MRRRIFRGWARRFPAIVGLAGFACCCAAQRNSLSPADVQGSTVVHAAFSLSAAISPATPPLDLRVEAESADVESLPDAPTPNPDTAPDSDDPPQQTEKPTTPGFPPISPNPRPLPPAPREHPSIPSAPAPCRAGVSTAAPSNISCAKDVDYFQRFVNSGVHPLTAKQKGILAIRNTTDPYNFATIAFISALSVASDPDSPYGPGFPGFGRNFGVAYCETAVGEFFGTFLIPSLVHQDPHYHRMPNASYPRRTLHAITQVVWAQSNYGQGMPNYANLVATAVGDGLGNLYVPGRQMGWGPAASRYATAIATDPIDNFITEFLPDVARRVNIHIVLLQQIVNQVTKQN